jgi:hypothetical protein
MLALFTGTDSDALRENIVAFIEKKGKGRTVIRITDAHTTDDLAAALQGPGMFDGPRVLILDGTLAHEMMSPMVIENLEGLKESADLVCIKEEKIDAVTRKRIEKHTDVSEKHDAQKGARESGPFDLGFALQREDKKALWVGYMREIAKGSAPEMIHGILFWAAKQALVKAGSRANERQRALVAELAELPHAARRRGYELEYALEEFVLS